MLYTLANHSIHWPKARLILFLNQQNIMREQFLTKEGVTELREKLDYLKTVRRREIADAIHTAKEQGDLSENAEYVNAKEEQRRMEEEIAEIESILKHATIVTKPSNGAVSIGTTVTLQCNGAMKEYHIVGSNEANPFEGKISNESPIGMAILGKHKGEVVHIPTPVGNKECTIDSIQ